MSDDNYDDGLVHNHRWAIEPAPPGAKPSSVIVIRAAEQDYDDGLVHGHGWATETGK